MKIIFIFSCSGMFRDVPECSGMFLHVPCSWFYRRPKVTPDSQEFAMMIDTQRKVSPRRYVRFIEQL